MNPMQRVLSGIQPTADSYHLGNYLGALKQWIDLQDSYEAFYFIPDMHALTVRFDPSVLADRTRMSVAQLLAVGVDPARSTVTIVDWQTLAVGLPARDLAYFTGTSLDPEVRAASEQDLVAAPSVGRARRRVAELPGVAEVTGATVDGPAG